MLVYRVEMADGSGPYTCRASGTKKFRNAHGHNGCPNHPSVWEDIGHPEYGEFCGFHSLQSFYEWFEDMLRLILDEIGAQLCIYEIAPEYVRQGSYQLLFKKEHAKLVEKKSVLI
jgi:hypothetical protein